MINILIPEDIPSANKGEAALFFGIAKTLSLFGQSRIKLFSLHPDVDRCSYGDHAEIIDVRGIVPAHLLDGMGSLGSKAMNYLGFMIKCLMFGILYNFLGMSSLRFMRHDLWRYCVEADIVLMCHDSFYAPLYHGPLILVFKILGKPVMIYGSTILPPDISSPYILRLLRNALNRFILKKVDWITLRERLSCIYIRSLDVRKVDVYPDLAFIADTAPDDEIEKIFSAEGIPSGIPLCGFAFSQKEINYAHPELSPGERREKALASLVAMMDHITGVLGMHAVFIPHAIGPTPRVDDRIAADWVKERCANQGMVTIIRHDYTQMQLRGMAKKLDLTVGMRLHFTIDALCHQVPSLLITHRDEYRCHGIIGDMLGQSKYIYNIEAITPGDLIESISDLWMNREQVKADLSQRIPTVADETIKHAEKAKEILALYSGTTS